MSEIKLPDSMTWITKHSHVIYLGDYRQKFYQLAMTVVDSSNLTSLPDAKPVNVLLHENIVQLAALCIDMAFHQSAYKPPEVECKIFASDAKMFGGSWPLMNIIPMQGVTQNAMGLFVRMVHDMIHDKADLQLRLHIDSPDLVEYAALYLHVVNNDGLRLASCCLHEANSREWPMNVASWARCFSEYQSPTELPLI